MFFFPIIPAACAHRHDFSMTHPEPGMESLACSDAETVVPAIETLVHHSDAAVEKLVETLVHQTPISDADDADESQPSSPVDATQDHLPTVLQPPSRTHMPRASAGVARRRIQDTLEWENCDESSGRFLAVARQYDDEFDGEELEEGEFEQVTESHSEESESADDDDESYESSFVTDGSGSEEEDSEEEWTPVKKVCCHSESIEDGLEEPDLVMGEAAWSASNSSVALEPPAHEPPAHELVASECVSVAESSESSPEPRFLHDEELNSPAGFYKLWVL